MSNSATTGQKRKRTSSETPAETASAMGFVGRVAAVEDQFVNMLKNCQKEITESGKSQGFLITCCALYTFEKDIKDIKSLQTNDYGTGKMQQVRIGDTGEEILPVPSWMESGVALQAYFERKLDTNRPHSSGIAGKRGFEVPWRASVQLEKIPPSCMVASVQVSFINPASDGSPIIKMDHAEDGISNLYLLNDKLMNIRGQTYSECCQELGIFRRGYCYITLRVPLRLLIREQVKPLWTDLPHSTLDDYSALDGNDNVTLKLGDSDIKVDRQLLMNISTETRVIFGAKMVGQVNFYEMGVSKEALAALLAAVKAGSDYVALDIYRTTPSFLYELLALSTDWNVQSVKVWTQLALLERLCVPGVNLRHIPVDKLIKLIRRDNDGNEAQTGVKMVLLGFMFALRDMCLVENLPATMYEQVEGDPDRISAHPFLVDVFQPAESLASPAVSDVVKEQAMKITLTIRFWNIDRLHVRVGGSIRIGQIKAAFERQSGIPVYQQRMIFKDRRLDDFSRVSECGFADGDVIEAHTELVGC
ncbi:uncharacterized protein LOC129599959 [Paramacrobiotus metropolitanus]|uniref:uncharacterized protein LOC129599959 n=1 Tax=Paramacrobiotus metropolitanus TaxID=2943436 RepID=UPI002445A00D|nr:uncharacterized protein LOC129599959 [Paramacrobiotus metropolitanus]